MPKKPQPVEEPDDDAIEVVEQPAAEIEAPVRKPPRKRGTNKKKFALTGDVIRLWSNGALGFLQSVVTVAVICYAAARSNAWYLTGLGIAAKLALAVYAMSFVASALAWFEKPRSGRWLQALLAVAVVLIGYLAFTVLFDTTNATFARLIR